ncbi:MAG: threonine synthase [Acidobacteriota bacterium]
MTAGANRPSWQFCPREGRDIEISYPKPRCSSCGGLLEVRHAPPAERGADLAGLFAARSAARRGLDASGVWRYRELVLPGADADVVSHPEGNTPLLRSAAICRWAGVPELSIKHEGHNPTGSFKDRGMTVGITAARRIGARAVACASTGNTSASLAAYAALAGIPALVFVPAGQVSIGKLAQTLAYGARTLVVRGDFDACLALAVQASESLGVYLVNSVNPFRLEGQKTIVFEALEQLSWEPPDWIVLPAGNLGNTSAFGKALSQARDLGLISRVPRLAAVQAEGANPFARSFRDGFAATHPLKAETVATAIRIGDPASHDRGVAAIRSTGGVVTDVTDAEILEAKAVVDAAGIGCEPASAASIAGTRRLVGEGVIKPGESVLAVLTGHILKDPGAILTYHQDMDPAPVGANRPIEIEPSLGEVERVMKAPR